MKRVKILLPEISDEAIGRLTPMEMEVIQEAAFGFSSGEIAQRLGIALKTVEVHRHHIMQKTGARNFLHVVLVLYKKGKIV
jgi:two-component system, NarL family, response regulator DegU